MRDLREGNPWEKGRAETSKFANTNETQAGVLRFAAKHRWLKVEGGFWFQSENVSPINCHQAVDEPDEVDKSGVRVL